MKIIVVMKKLLALLMLMFGLSSMTQAQKFAYVDTQYILDNIPDYQMAQDQLNELAKKWQKEIDAKITEIEKMYKSFQADAVLLPAELKAKRENEIVAKEKELKELQKKRFGKDGDLYKKRSELVKPIQDKVFNAIQEYADERGYAIIFDRASGGAILYANARFDQSDAILKKLGYAPGNKNSQQSGNSGGNSPQRKAEPSGERR
jgi:outer membrane protein